MSHKPKDPEAPVLSRPANRRTAARLRVFLEAYERTGRVTEAARIAGIGRRTHYHKIKTDPAYRKAFEAAEECAAQALEDEAIRRAKEGVKRPVMYQGEPVKLNGRILYEIKYSDGLLIALLKRFRPKLYCEHVSADVTERVDIAERLQAARKRLLEMRAAG
jgi:hypothetical protein